MAKKAGEKQQHLKSYPYFRNVMYVELFDI